MTSGIKIPDSLKDISESEYQRFQSFLDSHPGKTISDHGKSVFYCRCGEGPRTVLTFAGGLAPFELLYDTILGLEKSFQVVVVDISPFRNPDQFRKGVNRVLDAENINRVVLFGQSFSGIIAQLYFLKCFQRVEGMVLTNTIAPRKKRHKKWVLPLFRALPLFFLKILIKKRLFRLSRFDMEIPPEIKQKREFIMTLTWRAMDATFTKQRLINLLKLTFEFNNRDGYALEDFNGWNGAVLNITSEDDPCHKDVDALMRCLPNTELYQLPTGFEHMAPQIHRDEFHRIIKRFIKGLV